MQCLKMITNAVTAARFKQNIEVVTYQQFQADSCQADVDTPQPAGTCRM